MKLELEFGGALCYTLVFIINGIEAQSEDFGSQGDESPETAEEYGCGNMTFSPRPATDEILAKYKITAPEYNLVAGQLAEGLSFGACGWCV